MIANLTLTLFAIALLVGIALPIVVHLLSRKEIKKKISVLIIGVLSFILITVLLQNVMYGSTMQSGWYLRLLQTANENPGSFIAALPISLYQAVVNALFVVIAIIAAYRIVGRKRDLDYSDGFSLGFSYATIGIIVVLMIPNFINFFNARAVNAGTFVETMLNNDFSIEQINFLIVMLQMHTLPVMITIIVEAVLFFFVAIAITIFLLEGINKKIEIKYNLVAIAYLIVSGILVRFSAFLNIPIFMTIVVIIVYAPAIYYLTIAKNRLTPVQRRKKWKKSKSST